MAVVRKKNDDKYLKALRELVTSGKGNRQCFDCSQKGPTYVNMTIGSFVCTRCSGVLRGLTPPHRIKSISMATFTHDEIEFLKTHGNEVCSKTWLGLWDPKRVIHQDHRELMIDKYERKRYYLEPASPLKSLTNAASLKSHSTASTTSSSSSSTPNSINGNGNSSNNNQHMSNGYSTNAHNKHIDNSFQNIQLTPPTSQRTHANGLHKAHSTSTSSTAISRPTSHHNGQHNNNNSHHQDAFSGMNGLSALNGLSGLNGFHSSNGLNASMGSTSTGALSDTSSCASNGFGPDADFVADFGSANIFDATSSPAASVGASTNGYAKIQPIKMAHQQQRQQNSAFANMNGNVNAKLHMQNAGNSSPAMLNGNTAENFADFDHAPIYNATGALPIPNGFNKGSASANNNNSSNSSKLSSTPGEDRYAALKDLDEQVRESKAAAAVAASITAATVGDSFGNNNNVSIVNPFKSQQQQQHQSSTMVNPFQGSGAPHNNTQNLYGQMTVIPNGMTTNGFAATHQQMSHAAASVGGVLQPQSAVNGTTATGFFNYSNGFAAATTGAIFTPPALGGPNGCGFGFGAMQQQMSATAGGGGNGMAHGGVFNNPFAATGALSSNNPFL